MLTGETFLMFVLRVLYNHIFNIIYPKKLLTAKMRIGKRPFLVS